ncbi:hypothetical protein EF879_15860 [Micromonospora sp. HM5-17]|nr:hypothetical protein EF879_15860 [Micromonospora sp. HM5-17]
MTGCGGRWILAGAELSADGTARPMAWHSPDGRAWEPFVVRPDSHYGRRAVLYATACRDGVLAALGTQAGGAHGNPRVTAWRQAEDGALVEVPAPFELFGGPDAAHVGRMTAGPAGWLIVGSRVSGAAVWRAGDPARFELVAAAPGLASDAEGRTWAFDAVAGPDGWLVVGGVGRTGRIERDPLAWVSRDGLSWQRRAVPGAPGYDELQRVVLINGHAVAVGPSGSTFGVWRDEGRGWVAVGHFGRIGGGAAIVADLAVLDGELWAAVSDGRHHRVWVSADEGGSWREVPAPVPELPAGGGRAVALAAQGHRLLIVVDDGSGVRLWGTPAPSW